MALVKCRECGKRISTEASTCPRCGCPDPGAAPPSPEVTAPVHASASLRQQAPSAVPANSASPTQAQATSEADGELPPSQAPFIPDTWKEAPSGVLAAVLAMLLLAPPTLVPIVGLLWGGDYPRWRAWARWMVPIACLSVMGVLSGADVSGPAFLLWALGVWLYGGTILWVLTEDPVESGPRLRRATVQWTVGIFAALAGLAISRLPYSLP